MEDKELLGKAMDALKSFSAGRSKEGQEVQAAKDAITAAQTFLSNSGVPELEKKAADALNSLEGKSYPELALMVQHLYNAVDEEYNKERNAELKNQGYQVRAGLRKRKTRKTKKARRRYTRRR